MRLPDFLSFEPFNSLRQRMGASELGHFEFFDPDKHLTGLDRLQLAETGIAVRPVQVRVLLDRTLAFKNSRVVVYRRDPGGPLDNRYHLAGCETVRVWQSEQPELALVAKTTPPGEGPDPRHYGVCRDCLQALQYQGFDGARGRHRHFSEQVFEQFDLGEYFAEYPPYPVKEERRLDLSAG